MAEFKQGISEVDTRFVREARPVESSGAPRALQRGIEAITPLIEEGVKQTTISEFSQEHKLLQEQLTASDLAKVELTALLTSTQDKDIVNRAFQGVETLNKTFNGETRRKALLTKFSAEHPWLAPEFRKINSMFASNGGATSSDSALSKGNEAYLKNIQTYMNEHQVDAGTAIRAIKQSADLQVEAKDEENRRATDPVYNAQKIVQENFLEMQQKEVTLGLKEGTLTNTLKNIEVNAALESEINVGITKGKVEQDAVNNLFTSKASTAATLIQTDTLERLANGEKLDAPIIEAGITQVMSELQLAYNAMQAEAKQKGVTLQDYSEVSAGVDSMFAGIRALVQAKDQVKMGEDQKKLWNTADQAFLRKTSKAYARMVSLNMPSAPLYMSGLTLLEKTLRDTSGNVTQAFGQLEALVGSGGDTISAKQAQAVLEAKSLYTLDGVDFTLNAALLGQHLDSAGGKMMGAIISRSILKVKPADKEEEDKVVGAVQTLANTDLEALADPKIVNNWSTNPQARPPVQNRVNSTLAVINNHSLPSLFTEIEGTKQPRFELLYSDKDGFHYKDHQMFDQPPGSGGGQSQISANARNSYRELTRKLNMVLPVMDKWKMLPEGKSKDVWVQDQLNKFNQSPSLKATEPSGEVRWIWDGKKLVPGE